MQVQAKTSPVNTCARSISSQLLLEDLNKPLPSLPVDAEVDGEDELASSKKHSSHTIRTKLSKVGSRRVQRRHKLPIAVQGEQSTVHNTNAEASSHCLQISQPTHEPFVPRRITTTAAAAELSRKISSLMSTANLEDTLAGTNRRRMKVSMEGSVSTYSPRLQRGKEAFGRAKRAIADRLTGSAEKKMRTTAGLQLSSSADQDGELGHETDNEVERGRLNRRIAEGVNLSKSKIHSLTGDGNVPRKPLPVYESMRSLKRQSSSSGSLSDKQGSLDELVSPAFSSFDVDFDKAKGRRMSAIEPLISSKPPTPPLPDQTQLINVTPPSRFSERISGLAQHSDVMLFSSPPVGFSTPTFRLEPLRGQKRRKESGTAQSISPSLPEFDWEEKDEYENMDLPRPLKTRPMTNESLKRKSASADLRVEVVPTAKKIKKAMVTPIEDVALNSRMAKLDTSGDGALKPKDKNKRLSRSKPSDDKGKGLSIFDIGKGKTPMPKMMDTLMKARGGLSGKRASISGPASATTTHHRRASTPLIGFGFDPDESTSMDELQMS